MSDLRYLALEALNASREYDLAPDSDDLTDAIVRVFDTKENFLAALRVTTGIDDALWKQLGVSILP